VTQQFEILSFLYFPFSPPQSSTYSATPGTHHEICHIACFRNTPLSCNAYGVNSRIVYNDPTCFTSRPLLQINHMLHAVVTFKLLLKKGCVFHTVEGNVVCISTGLLAGRPGSRASILSRGWQTRDLSLIQRILTFHGTHPASYLTFRNRASYI
jgi:hypothetical protein